MKTDSSCPPATSASGKLILGGLIATAASVALLTTGAAQTNPIGASFHTVDGQFDALGVGEWAGTTPAAFISSAGGSAIPTTFADPNKNSLLWASLGRTSAVSDISLHLLYDFLPRDVFSQPLQPGELLAAITFPVTLPPFPQFGVPGGDDTLISVLFSEALRPSEGGDGTAGGVIGGFFDIFVDVNLDGIGDVSAAALGIRGAAGFGPSPLSGLPHLLVELDVPLRIPAGFGTPGGPLPGGGINPATGLYDPDPAFWGAAAAPGGGTAAAALALAPPAGPLQPASSATFTINPDASLTLVVPEPSSAALLLAGLGVFAARRRRARGTA